MKVGKVDDFHYLFYPTPLYPPSLGMGELTLKEGRNLSNSTIFNLPLYFYNTRRLSSKQ